MYCLETRKYARLDVMAGQLVELLCNISLSVDIMWTYENDKGHVDYIYLNGHIDKPRIATTRTAGGFHSLVISDASVTDSGLYDCYAAKRLRKVGYHLVVAST